MNLRRILSPEEAEPFVVSVLDALRKPLPVDPIAEARVERLAENLKQKPRQPWRNDWGAK